MPSLSEAVGFEMEMVWVPIVVAIISGPLVVVLQRLRKENTEQHEEGGDAHGERILHRVGHRQGRTQRERGDEQRVLLPESFRELMAHG